MFPRLFQLGSFSLPTYGLLVATGVLVGLWVSVRMARRQGIDAEKTWNLGILVVLSGILGAKVLMILVDLGYYTSHPREIFSLATLQAGGVFSGGFLAALLAAGPESDRRDPRRALSLLENVMRDVDVDPSSFEIRAAAHAMIGDFDEAQRDQKKAMAVAKKLGWDPKPLQERQDRYAAHQTWTGELMVY